VIVLHTRSIQRRIAFLAFSKFSDLLEQIGSTFWSFSINSTLPLGHGVYSPGGEGEESLSKNIAGVFQAED
jgi:hypothetical protein